MNHLTIGSFFWNLGFKAGRAIAWPAAAVKGLARGFRAGSGL